MEHKRLFDNIPDEKFICLAQESRSMSEFMLKLGYASGEGTCSRQSVKKHCLELGIEPPHATGLVMAEAAIQANTKSDEEYFRPNTRRTGHNTRDRLIRNNLLEYKCAICGNTGIWNNQSLTLEVDHINGDHQDNRIENLRFLCPNCHAQTETFRGRKHTKI